MKKRNHRDRFEQRACSCVVGNRLLKGSRFAVGVSNDFQAVLELTLIL